jgi:hypothetical protein
MSRHQAQGSQRCDKKIKDLGSVEIISVTAFLQQLKRKT